MPCYCIRIDTHYGECNVVVCSFDVLGRNSMVCRGGGGDGVDYVGAFCRVANR